MLRPYRFITAKFIHATPFSPVPSRPHRSSALHPDIWQLETSFVRTKHSKTEGESVYALRVNASPLLSKKKDGLKSPSSKNFVQFARTTSIPATLGTSGWNQELRATSGIHKQVCNLLQIFHGLMLMFFFCPGQQKTSLIAQPHL